MQDFRVYRTPENRVIALFETGTEVFELPHAATLEHLAGRLARLSELHGDALVSVDVRIGHGSQQ
jgi:hypothetical protein